MLLKQRRSITPEINVGSFSDIAFLLIIFFILTTTFVRPAGDRLQIPAGTTDQSKREDKQITLNLRPGEILYGEKNTPMTLDQLRATLLNANLRALSEEKRMVVLDSAPEVAYEDYFQVVMAIANAGGVLALVDHEEGGSK
jgi:biopolymer transport protein ExbD